MVYIHVTNNHRRYVASVSLELSIKGFNRCNLAWVRPPVPHPEQDRPNVAMKSVPNGLDRIGLVDENNVGVYISSCEQSYTSPTSGIGAVSTGDELVVRQFDVFQNVWYQMCFGKCHELGKIVQSQKSI